MKYVLSIDAGTTSSRALLINKKGELVGVEQKPFTQHYPNHGWIEHDPIELIDTQFDVISQLLTKSGVFPEDIEAIGIANQRETTIVWDKETGEPIWKAIVWNDRRNPDCFSDVKAKHEKLVHDKTGLFIEPYFSASKIDWILNEVKGARERAENGELLFGTVNTWILWHLTGKKVFATDVSNASRTLLFNIHTLEWDEELLKLFDIPKAMLPAVVSNSEVYGKTDAKIFPFPIPIAGMAGDQQAALFGHACFNIGDAKCTYGTGAFMMMNTGPKPTKSKHKLLTTVAWQLGKTPCEYALEGLVYSAGSAVSWLKNKLGIIKTAKEIESLAYSVPDSGYVYFVPSLNGLACPYWNAHASGSIFGIKASTNIGHIARATLEGIAFQVDDVLSAMQKDTGVAINNIKGDGGMSENVFLLQIQSDLLGVDIARSSSKEMTALGAGYLAGLAVDFWKDRDEIKKLWKSDRKFTQEMKKSDVTLMKKHWKQAVKLTQAWAEIV